MSSLAVPALLALALAMAPARASAGPAQGVPAGGAATAPEGRRPVLVGLDAEFGYARSTSAEAIRQGMLIAIEEINAAGGVLGGRPLALVERANHSVPARSIENVRELAAMPDLVAVFCGRFSPTVLEVLPTIHELRLPLLAPWSAADAIVDNGQDPNFVFRLSMRDSWAVKALLREVEARGLRRVGLLLLNTSWGRSSLKAAEGHVAESKGKLLIVGTRWFNWNDPSFIGPFQDLLRGGAQAIVLVSNANEAAILVREVAALPAARRLPILSHWGVSGGELPELAGPALREVDFSLVQTYSFLGATDPRARRVLAAHQRLFGSAGPRDIRAPVGVAHAYDLTHLLARAIARAGSTDRLAVRDALEGLGPYAGLIRSYPRPFTRARHEALTPADVVIARYAADGAIVRAGEERPRAR
jgi:branched-chain amino acid transport system substrate-binding protein